MQTTTLCCERCHQPYPADAYAAGDEGRFSGCCPACWNIDDDAEAARVEAVFRRNLAARIRRCRQPHVCMADMLPLYCTRCGYHWQE